MAKDEEKIDENLTLLAKSSIIVFIGIFLSKLFTYLYKIVVGRYYGPDEYGVFSIALVVLGVFTAVASVGLSDGLNRFLPIFILKKEEKKINYLLFFTNKIFLFTSLFSAILLFSLSNVISVNIFHDSAISIYLKIFALAIPFQVYSYIYYSVIRSYEKISAYSFGTNILQNVAKFIFILLFIYLGASVYNSISYSYVLGIFILAVFGFYYCKHFLHTKFLEKGTLLPKEKIVLSKEVFSYSWPILLFSVIGSVILWIDTFSIGILKDSYWVGIYNAAVPIAFLLFIFTEIFMQLFFPIITKELSNKNYFVSSELSKQVLKWIFIINLPALFLIILFPGVLINFFWGEEYLAASNSLIFLSIGYFFFSLATVSNNMISSLGKSKTILNNLIVICILNLALNFLLIPRFGIEGAALATMICFIIWSMIIFTELYLFSRILPFRRKLLNVFLSASIPLGGLYFLKEYLNFGVLGLMLFAFIYGIIYLLMLILTKSLDKNDLSIIKKFKSTNVF